MLKSISIHLYVHFGPSLCPFRSMSMYNSVQLNITCCDREYNLFSGVYNVLDLSMLYQHIMCTAELVIHTTLDQNRIAKSGWSQSGIGFERKFGRMVAISAVIPRYLGIFMIRAWKTILIALNSQLNQLQYHSQT